jgi:hypothetical protein
MMHGGSRIWTNTRVNPNRYLYHGWVRSSCQCDHKLSAMVEDDDEDKDRISKNGDTQNSEHRHFDKGLTHDKSVKGFRC